MNPVRFLDLLNKQNRTPEEQTELDTELKRQAEISAAQQKEGAQTPAPAQEVSGQTAQPSAPEQPAEKPAEPTPPPYTVEDLVDEITLGINFLKGGAQNEKTEMALSGLFQAKYWLTLK